MRVVFAVFLNRPDSFLADHSGFSSTQTACEIVKRSEDGSPQVSWFWRGSGTLETAPWRRP